MNLMNLSARIIVCIIFCLALVLQGIPADSIRYWMIVLIFILYGALP